MSPTLDSPDGPARADSSLLGIDLGSSAIKIEWCPASGAPRCRASASGQGRPLATLAALLRAIPQGAAPDHDRVRIAITGSGHALSQLFPCLLVNEVAATARGVHDEYPATRTVIDLGGQFSKWILLGSDPAERGAVVDFASNGLCAAGAGAFLEQQASRLKLSVEALGELAERAPRGASIAGRCSVFAKSDMIHLQQKGTPPEEIAYGLCLSLARTFLATVARGRALSPPVMLVGGGAANPGLVRAFRAALDLGPEEVCAAADPQFLGAHGAALMAEAAPVTTIGELLRALAVPAHGPDRCGHRPLPPLRPVASAGGARPSEDPDPPSGPVRAYLGVDVGSVSTNLVLLDEDLSLLQGIYLPTRGRPVDVLQDGLDRIHARFGDRLTILGVGTTGSGRHLAAGLIGADAIHNEITAQLVSALAVAPDVDTIFEIGGQDSKFIAVREGRLADFEMNKICAGGTGSFLEEQADRLGIRIVDEFATLALDATEPCDLGARCTVFMDTELVRAQEDGAPLTDLCAGLAYAVARNYLEKVVAGRPIGRSILFQGGTASNAAVVQAFRQLLGRDVRVHPYNRISGAIGAAHLAARARPDRSAFLGWSACAGLSVRGFECHQCENRCQVNRVAAGSRAVHFGDICDRYAERDREAVKAARPFAELFAAREELEDRWIGPAKAGHYGDHASVAGPAKAGHYRDHASSVVSGFSRTVESRGTERIGLLRASLNLEFLPFWTAFLRELGCEPVLSERTSSDLLQTHATGVPGEVCLPIKAAAAQARALVAGGAVPRVFVPSLMECPPRGEEDRSHTCLYGQQLADMLRVDLGDRVIAVQFSLGRGLLSLVGPTLALAQALGRSVDAVLRALRRANAVYAQYTRDRQRLGHEALDRDFDRAVVVLGRPYNTHDAFLNLALARHLDRLGLAAIPWDLLPLDEVQLDPRWRTVPWHYNREQLRAIELVRRDPRLFPILVSSYGCGPDAFIVKHLEPLVGNRPRLLLEFDEHRGEAGLVTRLEAFADEIDEHERRRARRVHAEAASTPGPRTTPGGRRFFVPFFSEHAHIYAATLRAAGFEAEVLPPPDEASVHVGEQIASGRECHPYAVVAGELARLLAQTMPRRGDVFLVPNCATPCLLNQYGDGYRLALGRLGGSDLEIWEATTDQLGQIVGVTGMVGLYEGLLATDILLVLGSRLRPYQERRADFDTALEHALARVPPAVAARMPLDALLAELARVLWVMPRAGAPGTRPVVGVTGDLYTRSNPVGNAGLFRRLEQLGVEVWPSPYFATMSDLAAALELPHSAERGLIRAAAFDYLNGAVCARLGRRLIQHLPTEIAALAVEPPAADLIRLARPYVGPRTSHLIVLIAAKMADFLRRGAMGVVNAAGLNCMVGTAAAALMPALRADFDSAPIITLNYGGAEGPAQRIRLETFVEQVHARWRRIAA